MTTICYLNSTNVKDIDVSVQIISDREYSLQYLWAKHKNPFSLHAADISQGRNYGAEFSYDPHLPQPCKAFKQTHQIPTHIPHYGWRHFYHNMQLVKVITNIPDSCIFAANVLYNRQLKFCAILNLHSSIHAMRCCLFKPSVLTKTHWSSIGVEGDIAHRVRDGVIQVAHPLTVRNFTYIIINDFKMNINEDTNLEL